MSVRRVNARRTLESTPAREGRPKDGNTMSANESMRRHRPVLVFVLVHLLALSLAVLAALKVAERHPDEPGVQKFRMQLVPIRLDGETPKPRA
jgi:hypothetical protein